MVRQERVVNQENPDYMSPPSGFPWINNFALHNIRILSSLKVSQLQEEHHRKISFREEYIGLLNEFAVDYDERYLFDWIL